MNIFNILDEQMIERYRDFKGSTSRKEFWVVMVCHYVLLIFFQARLYFLSGRNPEINIYMDILYAFYCLVVIIPLYSLSIRRMHDTGRSGYWVLLNLNPITMFIGAITGNLLGLDISDIIELVVFSWISIGCMIWFLLLALEKSITKESNIIETNSQNIDITEQTIIKKRSLWIVVLLSMFVPVYAFYWFLSVQDQIKKKTGEGLGGWANVLTALFTFGIYQVYWFFVVGGRLKRAGAKSSSGSLYGLYMIFNMLFIAFAYAILNSEISYPPIANILWGLIPFLGTYIRMTKELYLISGAYVQYLTLTLIGFSYYYIAIAMIQSAINSISSIPDETTHIDQSYETKVELSNELSEEDYKCLVIDKRNL